MTSHDAPILVADLFAPLHERLIELLRSLQPEDWHKPTICSAWNVKDIASHLLDGSLRRLSLQRDGYAAPDAPKSFASGAELLSYLHTLNADWTKAMRRVSPEVVIGMLDSAGRELCSLIQSLDPHGPALFPVAWAGEEQSKCWFDIAREYTERWHHHQQIADAVQRDSGIMTRRFYHPVLETFLRALPFTYRAIDASIGTTVSVNILGEAGGVWSISRQDNGWQFVENLTTGADAVIRIPQESAWRLFTKRMARKTAFARFPEIEIEGDVELGGRVLEMVSIMA